MNFEDEFAIKSPTKFDDEHVERIDWDYEHESRNPFILNTWTSDVHGEISYIPIDEIRSREIRSKVFEKYQSIFPADALSWWMDQNLE